MSDASRLRFGAIALITGAVALFGAQLIRPDVGGDAQAILRSVAASSGAVETASLLYLAAAALLVMGLVALPSAVAGGPGSRLLYVATALSAVGATWYGIEAALMRFVDVLAGSPAVAAGATQLEQLNAGFGVIAVLPWFSYLAPLGVAIALRHARVTGAWLIGLWAAGLVAGFLANSPLGESVAWLATVSDALLSALVAGFGIAVLSPRSGAAAARSSSAASARMAPTI
jgi:hypothetical protein